MQLQVQLPKEYDESLKQQIIGTLNQAVSEVRQQTGIDSPWLNSKSKCAEWLGISVGNLNDLIKQGFPIHLVGGKYFFNKSEINKYLLAN